MDVDPFLLAVGLLGIDGRRDLLELRAGVGGAMQLDAKVSVVEGRIDAAIPGVGQYRGAVVAEKIHPRHMPSTTALQGEQAFAGGNVQSLAHSTSSQCLHDEDLGIVGDAVIESTPVFQCQTVDEDHHVLAQRPLVVEHVASEGGIVIKYAVQGFGDGAAGDANRRTRHMPLKIRRENYLYHGQPARTVAISQPGEPYPETGTLSCRATQRQDVLPTASPWPRPPCSGGALFSTRFFINLSGAGPIVYSSGYRRAARSLTSGYSASNFSRPHQLEEFSH
jgi:hypothetical protein